MAGDLELRGLSDLEQVARALKAAGGDEAKGLRRELYRSLNGATKGIRAEMKNNIGELLPRAGGLANDVQRTTRFATLSRLSGESVGVRIRARGKRSIRTMNATGTLRHPVFGNRDVWVTQQVPKGFLDDPVEKAKPELRRAVVEAIGRVRDHIYRSV